LRVTPDQRTLQPMVRRRGGQRGLTTLLFTDICSSSEIATELGDRRWRYLQARHHAEVRKQLKRHGGHEVDTAGDGFFATFSSPAAGVRCAFEIVRGVRELGLDIRAGLHIGEVELAGEKVGGIAVATAARVSGAAGPGEVLATDTIVHLVAGSGLEFDERGSRELKGIPGRFDLFRLEAVDGEWIGPQLQPQHAVEYREIASPAEPAAKTARVWLAFAGVSTLLLVAGLLAFERGSDGPVPQASTPAGPGSPAVVVDAASGVQAFPVSIQGGWASDIVLTRSSVGPSTYAWIRSGGCGALNACPGELVKVNGDSGAIVQHYPFDPLVMAKANDTIWFLTTNNGQGIFARSVDQAHNRITPAIPIIRATATEWVGRVGDIVRFAAGGRALWVADRLNSRVFRLDLPSGHVTTYTIDGNVDDITFGDGYLWVMDGVRATVTRIDPRPGGKVKGQSLSQLDTLSGIAFGDGYVWATDNSGDEVWRVSTDLHSTTPIAVGDAPDGVAYADGAIWVANFGNETVSEVDPHLLSVTRTFSVAVHPRAVGVADGKVWAVGDPYTDYTY
jgi:class 3 adenylate cyclase/sugar lactone lactonase YvrE